MPKTKQNKKKQALTKEEVTIITVSLRFFNSNSVPFKQGDSSRSSTKPPSSCYCFGSPGFLANEHKLAMMLCGKRSSRPALGGTCWDRWEIYKCWMSGESRTATVGCTSSPPPLVSHLHHGFCCARALPEVKRVSQHLLWVSKAPPPSATSSYFWGWGIGKR